MELDELFEAILSHFPEHSPEGPMNPMKDLFDNIVKQSSGGLTIYNLMEIESDISVKGYCSPCKMPRWD